MVRIKVVEAKLSWYPCMGKVAKNIRFNNSHNAPFYLNLTSQKLEVPQYLSLGHFYLGHIVCLLVFVVIKSVINKSKWNLLYLCL